MKKIALTLCLTCLATQADCRIVDDEPVGREDSSHCHDRRAEHVRKLNNYAYRKSPNNAFLKNQRDEYAANILYHTSQAEKCWKEALHLIHYLPGPKERDKALACFLSARQNNALTKKVLIDCAMMCAYCDINLIEEWWAIEQQLIYAEYHLTLLEQYKSLHQQL